MKQKKKIKKYAERAHFSALAPAFYCTSSSAEKRTLLAAPPPASSSVPPPSLPPPAPSCSSTPFVLFADGLLAYSRQRSQAQNSCAKRGFVDAEHDAAAKPATTGAAQRWRHTLLASAAIVSANTSQSDSAMRARRASPSVIEEKNASSA